MAAPTPRPWPTSGAHDAPEKVRLVNEYGQSREVGLCGSEIIDWAPSTPSHVACPAGLTVVPLDENDDLESDNVLGLDYTNYPSLGSRKLKAAELNSLTKACASMEGDFNANGVEDIDEAQALERADLTGIMVTDEAVLYRAVSHFVELHTNYFEPPRRGTGAGTYVIAERLRCDECFPLTYQVGRDSYWTGCTRRRRGDYDARRMDSDRRGMDFGQFGCRGAEGTCPLQPPVTTGTTTEGDRVVDHDLCALSEAGLLPLPDEPWLGMNHHSQFQCSRLGSNASNGVGGLELSSVNSVAPRYDFNTCGAVSCAGRAGCIESTPHSETVAQPLVPNVDCAYTPGQSVLSSVGFVAALYDESFAYVRGCIDESAATIATVTSPSDIELNRGFSRLCDGFLANPDSVLTAPAVGNFGKLICACDPNYFGEGCEEACPTRNFQDDVKLHVGGIPPNASQELLNLYGCDGSGYCSLVPPDPSIGFRGGRKGYWMCSEITASHGPAGPSDFSGSVALTTSSTRALEMSALVPLVPMVRTPVVTSSVGCGSDCYRDRNGNVRSVILY